MSEKTWKDIKGYEGIYKASNLGEIKRLYKNGKEKILKLNLNQHGYLTVNLSKNRKMKFYRVNRLIAETFIENPDNKPYVNHKNRSKR